MRTTDDMHEPEKHQPLGAPIRQPTPVDQGWHQKPDAAPGVQVDRNGRLRTYIPGNGGRP